MWTLRNRLTRARWPLRGIEAETPPAPRSPHLIKVNAIKSRLLQAFRTRYICLTLACNARKWFDVY